ncbi:choline/ethanolamine kinase family protein [Candidatus Xianfuyuplasma coldseepsis]|uniref:Phosphotransferase family protein n=1 Tax=Candidatus Xianfuyuplasma coldseepsis TaxID=2782163 RepID=A0A7L7KQ99_9MOLU|nr:choline/ethanolamine kinase family protein [Xianfuyuplasma coldseepsis]QMS84452.1 phosphotransferase family protein [Xianfuyuplasma coldseepsis]
MTHEQIIQEVTMQVLQVDKHDIHIVKRLMGGMSNYTYIIDVKGDLYTFRIPGKKAEKFVDRTIEKANIELVKPLSLNNDTVFLDIASGYKIAHYIDGTPLSENNPIDHLKEAAEVLHKIHDSDLQAVNNYDPNHRLECYESHLEEFNYTHTDRYLKLKAKWESLKPTYMDESRLVLCHGDSQVSNFVVTNNGLRLMDWEFTGNNDPFYDIACFGNNDFNHALQLLPVYLNHEPTTEDYNRLYFFRAYQCLQWHNVALYKEFIGLSVDLGVDFMFVANLYLDKTEKFLQSIQ